MKSLQNKNKPKFFIIAGENSGDLHGSNLVRAIQERCPDAEFYGLGGEQLKQAGVNLLFNIVDTLAIVGFAEVFTKYFAIKKVFNATKEFLAKERPDAIILIDYPGFNLRMAREAKNLGITVFYYICPQVWAWRRGRIKTIAANVDKMLVVFPFEVPLLKDAGVDVTCVGHPLLDVINLTMTKEEVFEYFGFDPNKKLIGLLPGSRTSEINRHLPVMLEAAELIAQRMPDVQFVIPRASTIKRELIDFHLKNFSGHIFVVDQYRYNVRSTMDFAIVASGTATLETAFLGCPMIIVYKVSFLSYLIAKSQVSIPYIGLVNIIAGNMLVPELIQNEATAHNIAEKTLQMLNDPETLSAIRYGMQKIKEKMGGPGASARAAKIILDFLNIKQQEKNLPQNQPTNFGA
ncbi:lipid-A-disaccharide synthase [Candidatus Sumerlaeota bacterium]|nr:lipid-A-disaccharide synthase [Candidatus Sumerlaeota bacterium]